MDRKPEDRSLETTTRFSGRDVEGGEETRGRPAGGSEEGGKQRPRERERNIVQTLLTGHGNASCEVTAGFGGRSESLVRASRRAHRRQAPWGGRGDCSADGSRGTGATNSPLRGKNTSTVECTRVSKTRTHNFVGENKKVYNCIKQKLEVCTPRRCFWVVLFFMFIFTF